MIKVNVDGTKSICNAALKSKINKLEYTLRIFGLIDPDIMRFYRQQLDKTEIIKDRINNDRWVFAGILKP